jgi:hypothetical protein
LNSELGEPAMSQRELREAIASRRSRGATK